MDNRERVIGFVLWDIAHDEPARGSNRVVNIYLTEQAAHHAAHQNHCLHRKVFIRYGEHEKIEQEKIRRHG